MPNTLSDALKAAKTDRNVLSKIIIWESGVSKSQFYRIIKGQEAPSLETKEKIAQSLSLELDQFDLLFNTSKQEQKPSGISSDGKNTLKTKWLAPLLALSVVLVGVTALTLNNPNQPSKRNVSQSVVDEEDSTLFIEDVTIPDGSSIPINTTFEKIWRVQNTGNVVWKDRYLTRMTPASSLICSSPARVPIPETQPGETIDIAVTFKTPYLPGSCRTDWKTTDKHGNVYFPDMHGLYSIVVVTSE